jgi:hypothetical protein
MMLVMPTLQGLVANAIVNAPKGGWIDVKSVPPGVVDQLKSLATNLTNLGSFVAADKVWSMLGSIGSNGPAAAKFSLGGSTAVSAWALAVGHAADLASTSVSLIGRDTNDLGQARLALAEIDKLLSSPVTYMSNPNPALSYDEAAGPRDDRIEALQAERAKILERHPSLR